LKSLAWRLSHSSVKAFAFAFAFAFALVFGFDTLIAFITGMAVVTLVRADT
jgi:hypothetical protein